MMSAKRNRSSGVWLTCLFLALALAGCSSSDDGVDSGSGNGMPVSALEGTWRSDCVVTAGQYEERQLTVSGNTFTRIENRYSDSACLTPESVLETSGSLSDGDVFEVPGRPMLTELDIIVSSAAVTFYAPNQIAAFNNSARCARTDWQVGTSYDVTDCEAVTGTSYPSFLYDVFLIDGDDLYLGNEGPSSSEAARPNSASLSVWAMRII